MSAPDISSLGAVGLGERFEAGRLSPVLALDSCLKRITKIDPVITAFNDLCIESAKREAQQSETRWRDGSPRSPLDGVPVAVKANIAVRGLPHHAGIAAYRDDLATADALTVARMREAGMVVLGTLNMHEGALGATTDNPAFGRTENPRHPGFTPGGSSGGSAAAVASGLVPLALGSDTMGSVRIPSAYCGCVGHKPSPDLVPLDGVKLLSGTLDHVGPHARFVTDLIALTKLLAGMPDATTCKLRLGEISFGVWDWQNDVSVDVDVAGGFGQALDALRIQGVALRPVTPPLYDYGADRRTGLLISEAEAAIIHAERLAFDPEGFSEDFRKMMAWGRKQGPEAMDQARERLQDLRAAARGLFHDVDFVLAPVAPQTAFSWESPVPANQADFTAWANLAGLPATVVTTGLNAQGLPLALQVIGPPGLDQETLVAARELETVFGVLPVANPAT